MKFILVNKEMTIQEMAKEIIKMLPWWGREFDTPEELLKSCNYDKNKIKKLYKEVKRG